MIFILKCSVLLHLSQKKRYWKLKLNILPLITYVIIIPKQMTYNLKKQKNSLGEYVYSFIVKFCLYTKEVPSFE